MHAVFKTKLQKAIFLLFLVIIIGVLGFIYWANYSFIDAFYMTIITVSTVGFGEVHPMDADDKLFTAFLILISLTVFGYIISVLTEYIANGKFLEDIKTKKVENQIKQLENHTIVCGYGRNGRQAVEKLNRFKEPVLVIEKDPELIKKLEEQKVLHLIGDATEDDILEKAKVQNAKNLIASLPTDASNLYIVLSAKQINQKLNIVSRASCDSASKKIKIAGANNVIMPDRLGGDHMASLIVTPNVVHFIDNLAIEEESHSNVVEIPVKKLPSEFIGKQLRIINEKTKCTVIGYKVNGNDFIVNPNSEMLMKESDLLIVLGQHDQLENLYNLIK
ncbi:potassium channel family protein [Aureivirga sp. CE67]|uniref:potassium channel family protein n=1 Tax=Aureivirga sp. CE67 TaxID=1788983 RepID=UPI0018CAE628|nr:potassium channel protein [Aureivirga sp. CE67]